MKINKLEKKLVLNKKTVADLGNEEMGALKGGNYWESYADPTVCIGQSYSDCVNNCNSGYGWCN